MGPMWTSPVKIEGGGQDPLAATRVANRIKEELLKGITSQTQRARYYSFFTWTIYDIQNRDKAKTYRQFREGITNREKGFIFGCLSHNEESDRNHTHIAGYNESIGQWEDKKNIILDFQHLTIVNPTDFDQ
jgi:hypothetical protein